MLTAGLVVLWVLVFIGWWLYAGHPDAQRPGHVRVMFAVAFTIVSLAIVIYLLR